MYHFSRKWNPQWLLHEAHVNQVWYFISKNQPGLWTFWSTQELSWIRSHSKSVSSSVGIMSSCSHLAFLLLVSVALSHLHCLCFLVSQNFNSARLLIVATPALSKQLIEVNKSKVTCTWQQCVWCNYCAYDKWGHTNKPTRIFKAVLGTAGCMLHMWPAGLWMLHIWEDPFGSWKELLNFFLVLPLRLDQPPCQLVRPWR